MYQWFNRVTEISDAQAEPPLEIEKDETLWCTPKGQVSELGSRTVFSFTKEKAERLRKEQGKPEGSDLIQAVTKLLKLPESIAVPDYRILRRVGGRKYPAKSAVHYAVETEPGIFALVTMLLDGRQDSRPPRLGKRAVLYISHQSADAELRDEPLVKELLEAEPNVPFFACDVRGIGESQPDPTEATSSERFTA
jgi:hypothetical protein